MGIRVTHKIQKVVDCPGHNLQIVHAWAVRPDPVYGFVRLCRSFGFADGRRLDLGSVTLHPMLDQQDCAMRFEPVEHAVMASGEDRLRVRVIQKSLEGDR